MTLYTLRIEDPAGDPDALAEAIGELEVRGFRVECAAFAERQRLRARDELLREAHGLMSGTPWGRCVALEREIARFEVIQWPRLRDHGAPPEGCSALRRYLFQARRLGPLPSTARQLRNIIAKRHGGCDFGEKRFSSAPDPR